MKPVDVKRLVGYSETPTANRMVLPEGEEVFVRCGADILINGLMTGLRGESRCPMCGKVTHVRIDERRIEELSPKDSVLHVVEMEEGPGRLRIQCEATHIFDTNDCLARWLSAYSGKPGRILSLPDYLLFLSKAQLGKISPA